MPQVFIEASKLRNARRRPPLARTVNGMSDHIDAPHAMGKWATQLDAYITGQGPVQAMRDHLMPHAPWPDRDSPMLAYIVEAAIESLPGDASEEVQAAILWAVTHAWFEGALDQADRSVRAITG